MMPLLLQNVRDTNCRLTMWLEAMFAQDGHTVIATPEHMGALLSELLLVGEGLRSEPTCAKGNDAELDEELDRYRSNVERLRDLLPSIHSQLLGERSRLEFQRARVKSAAEWIRASRQTL
jgi:hypothetical protein